MSSAWALAGRAIPAMTTPAAVASPAPRRNRVDLRVLSIRQVLLVGYVRDGMRDYVPMTTWGFHGHVTTVEPFGHLRKAAWRGFT
ncbi:hypothetical protein GCM10022227_55230 [Streptomyces sedi]